jgi:hypothetical protein
MRAITVFAGPSLPPDARPAGDFDWRGPAAAGDLLALADSPPPFVCLIDGLFDSRPAPWHKELLLLMSAGTRLFGAASMGGLRAAELDGLGMVGVGAVYRAYRDRRLEGDDEVALVHGPESLRWAPLTVPMVEVRATLVAACRARLVDPETARRIRAAAHDVHFADRDWPMIARRCRSIANPETMRRIETMHVPLKRQDALACLAAARAAGPARGKVAPPPETSFMRALRREIAAPVAASLA